MTVTEGRSMDDLTPQPGTVDYPRDTCAKCGDMLCPAGWCVACKKQRHFRQAVFLGLASGVLVGMVYAAPRFLNPGLLAGMSGWAAGAWFFLPVATIVVGFKATAKIKRLRQDREADDERPRREVGR
jgi:hypothetical protein